MRTALQGVSSPLDATLETVLPGLHERLDAQRKATEDLHGLITRLESTVKAAIEKTEDSTMERLETEFHHMFRRIRGPPTDAPDDDQNKERDRDTMADTTIHRQNNHTSLPMLPITYPTIHQLYDHWMGGGEYVHGYPGGISQIEKEKGSSWRKDWDNGAKKRLSKVKGIIAAIEHEAQNSNGTIDEVIDKWESIYTGECNGKISNFHEWAVRNGKLEIKKARGRNKA